MPSLVEVHAAQAAEANIPMLMSAVAEGRGKGLCTVGAVVMRTLRRRRIAGAVTQVRLIRKGETTCRNCSI
jgi:hypothetical protein